MNCKLKRIFIVYEMIFLIMFVFAYVFLHNLELIIVSGIMLIYCSIVVKYGKTKS